MVDSEFDFVEGRPSFIPSFSFGLSSSGLVRLQAESLSPLEVPSFFLVERVPLGSALSHFRAQLVKMDVILEVADSFIFDHIYAWAFPAHQAPLDFPGDFASNATTALTSWQYKPSTTWFPIPVTEAAYNTAIPRDNLLRQGVSFFFIIWYVNNFLCHDGQAGVKFSPPMLGSLAFLSTSSLHHCRTSSCLTRRPSSTPSTSRIRSVSR